MIRHALVISLKDDATDARIDEVVAVLRALKDQIPEIVRTSAGRGVTMSGEPARTIGAVTDFADHAGFVTYMQHAAHRAAGAAMADIMSGAAYSDFEVDA